MKKMRERERERKCLRDDEKSQFRMAPNKKREETKLAWEVIISVDKKKLCFSKRKLFYRKQREREKMEGKGKKGWQKQILLLSRQYHTRQKTTQILSEMWKQTNIEGKMQCSKW